MIKFWICYIPIYGLFYMLRLVWSGDLHWDYNRKHYFLSMFTQATYNYLILLIIYEIYVQRNF
jgi:hypothetical protein